MVCPLGVLKECPKVYFLRTERMDPIKLWGVNQREAHCKKSELPLNFDKHMVRYEFRTLRKWVQKRRGWPGPRNTLSSGSSA